MHISNYTTITRVRASAAHLEALFYPFRVLPWLTRPPKSPVSNAKIDKRQPAAKRNFVFLSSSSSVNLASSPGRFFLFRSDGKKYGLVHTAGGVSAHAYTITQILGNRIL